LNAFGTIGLEDMRGIVDDASKKKRGEALKGLDSGSSPDSRDREKGHR